MLFYYWEFLEYPWQRNVTIQSIEIVSYLVKFVRYCEPILYGLKTRLQCQDDPFDIGIGVEVKLKLSSKDYGLFKEVTGVLFVLQSYSMPLEEELLCIYDQFDSITSLQLGYQIPSCERQTLRLPIFPPEAALITRSSQEL
ncbi:MAG: hypothetical protein EZS28_005389 [Streblomastix strix]|uniref:Uncharacterized protein n=1 Tax=Streblomastix strix TaxID=222440 RepID=A0A5J4WX30_9EUKA|nr:MAG: hypothetical protein EZS28_005389 [Streblomastix strix]